MKEITNIRLAKRSEASLLELLLILTMTLLIAWGIRVSWIANSQFELAQTLQQQGQVQRAMMAYERSLHAYLPLLNARENTIAHFTVLLTDLERSDQPSLALEGWRRLRGALLSTRHILGQPDSQTLELVNQNISRLAIILAEKENKMIALKDQSEELLKHSPKEISAFWGILQALLLIAWLIVTSRTIWTWSTNSLHNRALQMTFSLLLLIGWLGCLYLAG